MPYFENLGAKLYYEDKGSGDALVFLHGAAWDMRQWKRQVEYFSKMYRVITLDARGHGKSTLPLGKVSPDVFWQDVYALIKYLNIEKAIICGLSMGGHTAIQLAIHAPQCVDKLILIGAPCTNKFNMFERICVPINRTCNRILPMSWIAWSVSLVLVSSQEAKTYIKDVVGSMNHDYFNRVWKAATSMESRPEMAQINCPTLILIGEHDALTGRQQPYIHETISGSKLVTIKNANHGTNLDNPKQVEHEIENFLNNNFK